jgi:RimJ/RimL family protein N-acetyltransferase
MIIRLDSIDIFFIEPMSIEPITLIGHIVRLEPLSEKHIPDLAIAGQDNNIWRFMLYGNVTTHTRMQTWVRDILSRQDRGTDLPFAVVHLGINRAIGATRFLDIRPDHRGVEIGGTWYHVDYQRTAVNTECKYLLMTHAFETWNCIRVQFKTDSRNNRSLQALERIGAKYEGILRNHLITPDGFKRDSVYYSVIDSEWPVVKENLEILLHSRY